MAEYLKLELEKDIAKIHTVSIQYQAPSTRLLVPSNKYPVPNTQHLSFNQPLLKKISHCHFSLNCHICSENDIFLNKFFRTSYGL